MSQSEPQSDQEPSVPGMRLQRYLAQCGLGSRRECEELITQGRVEIDGVVADTLGTNACPSEQTITLDGEKLTFERKRYYLLNKPPGFLCTAKDPQGRRTIFDLFPDNGPRLFCVGRLDEATTGLLIVTNDGDLAQKLAHPRYRIHRLYKAQVAGHPTREVFEELKQGLFFTEGKFKVYDIRPVKKQGQSTWVEITMTEGQNREIRRLLARTGHKVMKLERIGFGPIRLGRVPMGQFRELRREELGKLFQVLEKTKPSQASDSSDSGKKSSDAPQGKSPSSSKRSSSKNQRAGATSKKSSAGKRGAARSSAKKPRRGGGRRK